MTSVRFADHNRESLRAIADDALIIVPVGACEPHGPHLPVATDDLLVTHIALEVAKGLQADLPTLVTPTLPFGFSAYHQAEGPTISIKLESLMAVLRDVLTSLVEGGCKRLFVLNGHGGNAELVQVAIRAFAEDHGSDVLVGAGSYWWMAWEDLVDAGGFDQARLPGHAGRFETATVLALRPDLVGRLPAGREIEPTDLTDLDGRYLKQRRADWHERWPGGFTDNPQLASAQHGQALLDAAVAGTIACLREFCSN